MNMLMPRLLAVTLNTESYKIFLPIVRLLAVLVMHMKQAFIVTQVYLTSSPSIKFPLATPPSPFAYPSRDSLPITRIAPSWI